MSDESRDGPTRRTLPRAGDQPPGVPTQDELIAYTRKFSPRSRELTDDEREFLDRYLTDDRVVGVLFGEAMVEVQVARNRGKVDLPETFGRRPVVVRNFPETLDGEADAASDVRPGPLADFR
jgi:hypothetical protein